MPPRLAHRRSRVNKDDLTVQQVVYFLSCTLCCREMAARSINEKYLYKVKYDNDSDLDIDLEEHYIKKVVAAGYVDADVEVAEVDVLVKADG